MPPSVSTPSLELRRLNRTLSTLSGCNAVLVHATDEDQLLNQICEIVVQVGGYRLAWVGYAEHDEGKAVRLMAKSGIDDGYIEKAQITWADTERGWGPAGTAIRTGEVCILRDILQNPQFTPWRDDAVQQGYASIISLPLREGSQTIGVLNIYAPEPDAFDDPEVELLKELADDLSYGITVVAERDRAQANRGSAARIRRALSHVVRAQSTPYVDLRCGDARFSGSERRCRGSLRVLARGISEDDRRGHPAARGCSRTPRDSFQRGVRLHVQRKHPAPEKGRDCHLRRYGGVSIHAEWQVGVSGPRE